MFLHGIVVVWPFLYLRIAAQLGGAAMGSTGVNKEWKGQMDRKGCFAISHSIIKPLQ